MKSAEFQVLYMDSGAWASAELKDRLPIAGINLLSIVDSAHTLAGLLRPVRKY